MKTYFLKTFGCQMNKHDSERIAGLLESLDYKPSKSISSADLVVYYTCCVRKSADQRFYGQLTSTKYKEGAIIAVGGCLAQKEGDKLIAKFKKIDLVFGTRNLDKLTLHLKKLNKNRVCDISPTQAFNSSLPSKRNTKHKAWITITQGCNNHCAYCIVPSVRGAEVSRNIEEIIREVKTLKKDSIKEITLLGQNVNSYGRDIYSKPAFAKLLDEVSRQGVDRIRFTTSHPKDLSEEIVISMGKANNICNHIHLPVQAGSDTILAKMGRKYSKKHYLQLLQMIRNHIPDVSITTDIMVGFPGETEDDFNHTLDLVKKSQFDQAFTFIFSVRDGTRAQTMPFKIDYKTKLKRFNKLIKLQNTISYEKNKKLLGEKQEVLVDAVAKKNNLLAARTKTNKLVHFKGDRSLIGKLVNVKIFDAKPFFLLGEMIE